MCIGLTITPIRFVALEFWFEFLACIVLLLLGWVFIVGFVLLCSDSLVGC